MSAATLHDGSNHGLKIPATPPPLLTSARIIVSEENLTQDQHIHAFAKELFQRLDKSCNTFSSANELIGKMVLHKDLGRNYENGPLDDLNFSAVSYTAKYIRAVFDTANMTVRRNIDDMSYLYIFFPPKADISSSSPQTSSSAGLSGSGSTSTETLDKASSSASTSAIQPATTEELIALALA